MALIPNGTPDERNKAKSRMLRQMADAYRCFDDSGEYLPPDQLRDDFEDVTFDLQHLTAVWQFLPRPIRICVRDCIESPALEVINSDGTTWQDYDRELLAHLEKGEVIAFD